MFQQIIIKYKLYSDVDTYLLHIDWSDKHKSDVDTSSIRLKL